MTVRALGLSLTILFLAASVFVVAYEFSTAQESAQSAAPPQTIQYRRYFIPDAQKADLVRGYVPVNRNHLEELLNESERSQGLAPPRVQLTKSEYIARFADGQLLDGFALLDFQTSDEQPVSAILHPLNIALGQGVWLRDERTPAALGTGRDAQHRVLVSRSGQLLIPWSMRGELSDEGAINFPLLLPSCPLNRLIIAVPKGSIPVADGGLVTEWQGDPNVWRDYPEAGSFLNATSEGHSLWAIEFAAAGAVSVSIAEQTEQPTQRALITARQNSRYSMSPWRLELQTEINLGVQRHAISGINVSADRGLQVIDARLGDQPIDWVIESQAGGGGEIYRLRFPQPVVGSNLTVRLLSHADLAADELWTLPRLRLQDVFWQEERVELLLAETLLLEQLESLDCAQTRYSAVAPESYEFQCYTPDHQLKLMVRSRAAQLRAEAGVVVRLDHEAVTARWITDVQATWGEQFRLRFRVARPWTVSQVDVDPSLALDTSAGSWRFENGMLDVPLREPVSPSRRVRLTIEARRRAPPATVGLLGEQLRIFQLLGTTPPNVLYRLQGPTQQQIRLVNDLRVERVDPQSLTAEELARVGGVTDGLILRGDSLRGATATLVQDVPRYAADIEVEANVAADAVSEAYLIRCVPESLAVRQVHVRLSKRREVPLQWRLDQEEGFLAARLISDPGNVDPADEGELWEVDLPTPRSSPFQLRAERKVTTTKPLSIALASAPDASAEVDRLVVRSFQAIRWENGGLEPLPLEPSADGDDGDIRGIFRYQPSQTDEFVIERLENPAMARTWVWLARYTTRLFADGKGVHEAIFRLQNTGRERIEIYIPEDLTVVGIDVDGRIVSAAGSTRPSVIVPLESSSGFPTVRVRYVTNMNRLGWRGEVQAPLPRPSLPVLKSEWIVLFPSDYQVWRADGQAGKGASLASRLLGPLLARQDANDRFGLTASQDELASVLLKNLGESASSERAVWGDVSKIEVKVENDSRRKVRLFVDEYALAARALSPSSPIGRVQEPDARYRGLGILANADLALIVTDNVALITTRRAMRSWSESLVPTNDAGVYGVQSGSWLQELLDDERDPIAAGFVSIGSWRGDTSKMYPWQPDPPYAISDSADAGWSAARIELQGSGLPARVSVPLIRTTAVEQWAWSAYLIAVAVTGWWCARRRVRLAIACGAATALALLMPSPFVVIGTATFLGAITATAVLTLVPPLRSVQLPAATGRYLAVSSGVSILLLAWLTFAQEPEVPGATAKEKAPPELRILIPTDNAGKPTGDYWYVSRELHELLVRNFETAVDAGGWMLRSANYRLIDTSAQVPEFAVQFDLETFAPNQIVELPFARQEVQLIDARIDSQPADIRLNANESAVLLTVADRGVHRLSLSLGARRSRDGAIDFAVPPVTSATLLVPAAQTLEIPTALGAAETRGAQQLVALGPAARMVIRSADTAETTMQPAQVQQQVWFRIRPNSVVVDAIWNVDVAQGRLDKLTILADPGLRLRPLANAQVVDGDPIIEQQDVQRIEFHLKPSAGSHFSLQASFLLSDASGVGRLRLPGLEVVELQTISRQFAVSHAPNIQLSSVETSDARPIAVEQFMQSWRGATDVPQLAYEIPADSPANDARWTATSRFQPGLTTADHQLTVRASADELALELTAGLTTNGGPVFQRRIALPSGVRITEVEVIDGNQREKARFAQVTGGQLTIFLPTPAGPEQRLIVHGNVAMPTKKSIPFPILTILDAETASMRVEVYRTNDVAKLEVQNLDHWSTQDQVPPMSLDVRSPTRFLGAWTIAADKLTQQGAVIAVTPNQPLSHGYLATRLSREATGWTAEVEYRIHIENDGLLDIVRLQLPNEWEGPLKLEPAYPFELGAIPGTSRKELAIRPPEAIDREHDFSVTIRGPLAGTAERVRLAPDLTALDVTTLQRFLVVPARLESQEIVWSTSGLVARNLPPLFQMAQQQGDAWHTYQILGNQFQAAIQRIERVAGLPQVRLADVFVYWSARKHYAGLVAFDIEPAGITECIVTAPATVQVHSIFVDGNPSPVQKLKGRQYQVTLGPPQLPQRIEVVFSGTAEQRKDERIRLNVPLLKGLPVIRTLWTINAPEDLRDLTWQGEWVWATRMELERLESTAAMMDVPFQLAADTGTSEARQWFTRWSLRVNDVRARLGQLQKDWESLEGIRLVNRLSPLDEYWRENGSSAVHANDGSVAEQTAPVQLRDLVQPWRAATRRGNASEYRYFTGAAPDLHFIVAPPRSDWWFRLVLSAAAIGLGLASYGYLHRPQLPEWVRQYPQAVLALGGVLWIAFLQPQIIGWVTLAIAVAAAIRSPFARRKV